MKQQQKRFMNYIAYRFVLLFYVKSLGGLL